jgi:predicted kinase
MILIVFGLPGSGKSYFAGRLANITGALYVNSDQLRKSMFPQPAYTAEEKQAVYGKMLHEMKNALNENRNIILDATFHKGALRKMFAEQAGAETMMAFIEITSDEAIIRERLNKKRKFSDADYEVYHKIKSEWESMKEPHLVLKSTNSNIDLMLQHAKTYFHF